jgi:hypothetical protein
MGPSAVRRVGGGMAVALLISALLLTCAHGQDNLAESRDGLALLTKRDTYSSSSSSHCTPTHDTSSLLDWVAELDYLMHSTLKQLPDAVAAARSSISESNAATNRDKLIVGLACFLAAMAGGLGVLFGKDPLNLPLEDQISFAAQHSWGYGYWGPFLLDLNDNDPGCGLEELNKVLYDYSFVTALHQTYGSNLEEAGYTSGAADDRPELRAYYLAEFGRKLKLELHCITSQAGGDSNASRVVALIDKYVRTGQERLEITSQLMGGSHY